MATLVAESKVSQATEIEESEASPATKVAESKVSEATKVSESEVSPATLVVESKVSQATEIEESEASPATEVAESEVPQATYARRVSSKLIALKPNLQKMCIKHSEVPYSCSKTAAVRFFVMIYAAMLELQ
uniref:Uncharacterized protein n=1 Tax=Aegilops tauschii subsp. strangulata TaxID=200361 RepID=A0A453GU09_AEGTS